MASVTLVRDPRTTLFAVPAFLVPTEISGARSVSGAPIQNFEFFLDTGSNETIIAQGVNDAIGIDLSHLERGPVAGIGGFTMSPVLRDFPFYLPEASGPYRLRLPKVSVMEDRLVTDTVRRKGFRQERERKLFGVSLFGLDSLAPLRATLTVQPHLDAAAISW